MAGKIIVIYKSSTGFTKKYAEMIAEEMKCALADYNTMTEETLSEYDTIVFGSRAHAGMIDGYKRAREKLAKGGAKQLVLFVTGATPDTEKAVIDEFWNRNLTPQELSDIPHFYMQSGLCYEKMSFSDRLMMKVFVSMLKKKKDKEPYEKDFEKVITGSYDISSREYIRPLVAYLKKER